MTLSSTEFEIRALVVRGRARYLSVKEILHNIESLHVSGEETFCSVARNWSSKCFKIVNYVACIIIAHSSTLSTYLYDIFIV